MTDLENGRIYLPPASIPGGHGLRSMALQAMAHRLLGHHDPASYADFLQQRLEINYFAAACLMPADAVGRLPHRGEERPQPRRRGLPRRVRRDPRGGRAALHQPRHRAPRHRGALPAGRRRRRAVSKGYENDGLPLPMDVTGVDRGPDRLPALERARRVRRAQPHDRVLPVHRHPGRHVLVLDPDRHGVRRGVLDHVRRAVRDAKWFRGRETTNRAASTLPGRAPAAGARPPRSPSAGRTRPGRAPACTRTSSRRCRPAPSPGSTTTSCTRSWMPTRRSEAAQAASVFSAEVTRGSRARLPQQAAPDAPRRLRWNPRDLQWPPSTRRTAAPSPVRR